VTQPVSAPTGHDDEAGTVPASQITLGILAGGRATRLDGMDKAWIERDGIPQVLRWRRRFERETDAMIVSANRDLQRYEAAGLHAIPDRIAGDFGPMAGLEALLGNCRTPWLFTIPVDLVGVNDCLVPSLWSGRSPDGAFAVDDEGRQPLVALWRVAAALPAVSAAIEHNETAIHALQARIGMTGVRLEGVRFGNLNTPEDLRSAGFTVELHRHD
jgi:molybdopterin-guanine dinucleotide biosynthesis protein A